MSMSYQYPGNDGWPMQQQYPTPTGPGPRAADRVIVALFKNYAVHNPAKSAAAGRKIFDDVEIVELRTPGSKDVKVCPAHFFSHWEDDPVTGEQRQVTYAERFAYQYRQFKMHAAQMMSGTPLSEAPFLTVARQSELRALNIYTVEALAHIDGQELKNLGQGGRELKNAAEVYLETARTNAVDSKLQAEVEALRTKVQMYEDDNQRFKEIKSAAEEKEELERRQAELLRENDEMRRVGTPTPFDNMNPDQLRQYIQTKTGFPVHGNGLTKKVLIRMAQDADKAHGAQQHMTVDQVL